MNYSEIKDIVRHLKKNSTCHVCNRKFVNEGIQVLFTFGQEGMFVFTCTYCLSQVFVHVSILDKQAKVKAMNMTNGNESISQNDVLDIHNFLNKFNGDFKTLFT